jgi:hypothetical protein
MIRMDAYFEWRREEKEKKTWGEESDLKISSEFMGIHQVESFFRGGQKKTRQFPFVA